MAAKKVIFVANTSWFLYNFRLAFARELQRQGFEVLLCAPEDSYSARLQGAGFRWIDLNLGRQTLSPWTELPALRALQAVYENERPHLVHHFTIKPVIYGTLAARRAGVPAAVNDITGRGYTFLGQSAKARLLNRLVRGLYKRAFRHPNHALVFENETDRQDFLDKNLVHTSQVYLIEGAGVDTAFFTPHRREDQAEPPLVVLPARMLWDKGVEILVQAARLLRGKVPVRVALVGEPDPGNPASIDEAALQAWDDEGIVAWWGFRQDMRQVYRESDIVTLPTMYGEGVPTVLMEAAACGLPLIATDIPGCRNVVFPEENGLLVPPGNPDALADAIARLAEDPALREKMGSAGRTLALTRFSVKKINAERLAVYVRVLQDVRV
jgi:glycosyltransferase involved in cell wall biosynthesis